MIVVAGHLVVDPANRDTYLSRSTEVVRRARTTEGCLDFAMSADLIDPARINIFERWDSLQAVEAFRGAGPEDEQASDIFSGDVREFDITNERQLM